MAGNTGEIWADAHTKSQWGNQQLLARTSPPSLNTPHQQEHPAVPSQALAIKPRVSRHRSAVQPHTARQIQAQ